MPKKFLEDLFKAGVLLGFNYGVLTVQFYEALKLDLKDLKMREKKRIACLGNMSFSLSRFKRGARSTVKVHGVVSDGPKISLDSFYLVFFNGFSYILCFKNPI